MRQHVRLVGLSAPTNALLVECGPASLEAIKSILEDGGVAVERSGQSEPSQFDLVLLEGSHQYDCDLSALPDSTKLIVCAGLTVDTIHSPLLHPSAVLHGAWTPKALRAAAGLDPSEPLVVTPAQLKSLSEATLLTQPDPGDAATELCSQLIDMFGAIQGELLTHEGDCWTDASTNLSTTKTQELKAVSYTHLTLPTIQL